MPDAYTDARINDLERQVVELKRHSHEPVDIAPRVYDEMERMVTLGRLFYNVPTEDLAQASGEGLTTYNYIVKAQRR